MQTSNSFTIDRVPTRFNEGPFWGNGVVGSMLYAEGNTLRFTYDHVQLWETRDPVIPQTPQATYQQLKGLEPKEYYEQVLTGAFPKNLGPCGTRLPSLTMKLLMPATVVKFNCQTDLYKAASQLRLRCDDGSDLAAKIYLHSERNILDIHLSGQGANLIRSEMAGWDYTCGNMDVLKAWGYPEATGREEESFTHLNQRFGSGYVAVMTLRQITEGDQTRLLVALNVGSEADLSRLEQSNTDLISEHLAEANSARQSHQASWKQFWSQCDINLPDERLQQAVQLERYKLFCNARNASTPVTLQGIWNSDRQMPPWMGDLHNDLNVQACYWAAFKTGCAELAFPYIKHYCDASEHFQRRAKQFTGVDGAIQVPTTMAPDGKGVGTEWHIWNTLLGPELYVAVDFCWYFEYTQNQDILRDKIYPFLTGVARLYEGIAEDGPDGLLHIALTHSPEIFKDGRLMFGEDSTFILSSLRFILQKIVRYAELLAESDQAAYWQSFLGRLAPEPISDKGYQLFPGRDLHCSHRHFSHLFPIYPLGLVSRRKQEDNDLMQASLDNILRFGYTEFMSWSFPYLAILAARCGRGNMARILLEIYCRCFRSRNSFTLNGDALRTGVVEPSDTSAGQPNDVFTLEAGLMVPAAAAEMMLHRVESDIFILPAIPDDWETCSARSLAVEGGHRIDLKMENYLLRELILVAGSSETVTLLCRATPLEMTLETNQNVQTLNCADGLDIDIPLVKGQTIRIFQKG